MKKMNILVTCDSGYAKQAALMLFSLQKHHPDVFLDIFVAGTLQEGDIMLMGKALEKGKSRITHAAFDGEILKGAPTTDRYPVEMYYRIFAAQYLPQGLERVLYLDPDLVVTGSLEALYDMEMADAYFAAASHVKENTPLEKINQKRLDMEGIYINSGVMLLNLDALRREQDVQAVIEYIAEHEKVLFLPDQDVISGLYSEKILPIDAHVYNMTERILMLESLKGLDADWVCRHSVIIHYCGKNKPWKPMYKGKLDIFYLLNRMEWEKKIGE
ncbi:MAG: glycosyltransferase family 8 protein [Anaerotignum sp.]|nr:glycosyltransferase family 8 protein [Anaerotignum sp.]